MGQAAFLKARQRYLAAGARDVVLHAIVLFGALCVVETIEGASQIASSAADALERLSVVPVVNSDIFRFNGKIDPGKIFARLKFSTSSDVVFDLFVCDAEVVSRRIRDRNRNILQMHMFG